MKQINSTALLKVKCISHSINPESMPFEEYISSSNTAIKIDFPNGKSLMEKGFKSIEMPLNKFYLEFFDQYDPDNMMKYLLNKDSDFRVTSLDGTVIRLSHEDNDSISLNTDDSSSEGLEEYEFVGEKISFFQKIKRKMKRKDN